MLAPPPCDLVMAWTPPDEDRQIAQGRLFEFRIGPWVSCELLAVRGVTMRNTSLVAMLSVIEDAYTGEITASLVTCQRTDVPHIADEDEDHEDGA